MHRFSRAALCGLLLLSNLAQAQTTSHTRPAAKRAGAAQPTSPFKPYASCKFPDGLQTGEILPLPSGSPGRTVETMHGSAQVANLRAESIFFSYPETDPFAKVTVEQIPAGTYDTEKASLIGNFEQILSSDDGTRNYVLKPTLNGFEIYGLDRPKLEPGALGVYLLIDDRTGIIATVHFLNAEPDQRKFSTLAEYASLRNQFLNTYTACIHPGPKTASSARP